MRLNGSTRSTLLANRARFHRFNPTASESLLWSALSAGKLGTSFRRQVPIGRSMIVDFLAPGPRVVVEVDGGYHERTRAADARRDRKLARLGYRVVRLDAELVLRNLPEAVARIRAALAEPR